VPVGRIERIVSGVVIGRVERNADGDFVCMDQGSNQFGPRYKTLEEVAHFLRNNPRAGVRMMTLNPRNPTSPESWNKVVRNIYIDGVPR
jgi:hypothetical protein